MTSTKNHVWINVHFPKDVHASLKAWCIRNGRSMQDGLVEMVALMSGPNGLRLTQPTAVVPTVLRAPDPLPRQATPAPVRAAPPKVAAQPDPVIEFEEEPELPFSNVDPDNQPENFDPDAFYALQRAKGNADAAGLTTRWCNFLGTIDDDWSPP